jgi:hypothetical protein
MGRDGIELRRDGTGWDGMGQHGMEWDGKGLHGMRLGSDEVKIG